MSDVKLASYRAGPAVGCIAWLDLFLTWHRYAGSVFLPVIPVSAIDSNGRTIWIVDAHRDDGKRFIVHAEELLTAFRELEARIRAVT